MNITFRRIGLILLIMVSSNFFIKAQGFNKRIIFEDEIPAMDFSAITIKGDTIITIGRGAIWEPPYYPGKIMITKFNFLGDVINWFNEYGSDTITEFIPFVNGRPVYEKENKMLVVGGAGGYFANDFGFAAIFDNHSSVDWIKIYPPSEDSYQYSFLSGLILENNDLLFLAYRNSTGITTDFPVSGILIYADSLGNVLWEKEYTKPSARFNPGYMMIETDTTFLLGFDITEYPIGEPVSHRSVILRVNQSGDILHQWQNDNPNSYSPKKILRTPDGGLVFASKALYGFSESSGSALYQGYICKLDAALNKEWELTLGHRSAGTYFHSMMETYDGKFIAAGAVVDSLNPIDSWRQYGWVVKFDETGVIEWEQKILSESNRYSEIYDIAETDDHDLVACGLSQSYNGDYPQQGWLLKMDEYGCVYTDSCSTVFVNAVDELEVESEVLRIAPNPTGDVFRISFQQGDYKLEEEQRIERVQVFDLMGQVVLDQVYRGDNEVEIDVADWAMGMYVVLVNGMWVEKVVVGR